MIKEMKKVNLGILLLILLMLFFLVFKIKLISVDNEQVSVDEKKNVEENSEISATITGKDYEDVVAPLYKQYLKILQKVEDDNSFDCSMEVIEIKNKLDDMFVSGEDYKKVHLNMSLSIARLLDSLNSGDDSSLRNALNLARKLSIDYDWLK